MSKSSKQRKGKRAKEQKCKRAKNQKRKSTKKEQKSKSAKVQKSRGHYGLTSHAIKMSKCLKNSGKVLKTQARSLGS